MLTFRLVSLVLLAVILLEFSGSSDAWWRRRRGRSSHGGRHTVKVNGRGGSYNYRGRNWRGGIGYNHRSGGINFNAGKGRHNFRGNYNHRNRNWGIGYTWRWGRKRRDLGISEDAQKLAEVRLRELGEDVAVIKTQLSSVIPNIKHLTLPTHKGPITDKDLAQDILCLVHQLGKILPQLEAFTKKMFTKHSFAYGLKADTNIEKVPGCQAITAPQKATHHVLSGGDLTEMKTFVGALILTRLELKAALPQEKTEKDQ